MNFVDKVKVTIVSGNGGDGRLSFRHEKFVDRGGPDGGDGGDGGDVIAIASWNQNTLASYRYQKKIQAEDGAAGGKKRMHGKSGADLVMAVPVGTVIGNDDGQVIADLTEDGQQAVVARGGKGGFGNAHFTSSTRQAPRIAEKGERGEELTANLELKMIADVGLVGLPNAGKSTLLSVISNARPEIADYPFTTLTPNLGVVDVNKTTSLLVADIPGLIAGAAEGKGLGDEFLRHVERTGVLLHLIDVYQDNVADAYKIIQHELAVYKVNLAQRPQIVVLTKVEGTDSKLLVKTIAQLRKVVPVKTPIMAVSSQAMVGIAELLKKTAELAKHERQKQLKPSPDSLLPVIRFEEIGDNWQVKKIEDGFLVTGEKIERFARRTEFTSEDGLKRLKDIMKKTGITNELARQGAQPGAVIQIAGQGVLTY